MADALSSHGSARPSRASLVAAVLVVVGAVLAATVDMAFLVVLGLGAFAPGLLRELGLLGDQDEFQLAAARRAGYHAYLAAGLLATGIIAWVQRGSVELDGAAGDLAFALVVLLVVWLLSRVFAFWDTATAASRILLVFGSFWMVFIVLSHLREPLSLLMESLVAAPFFALAATARRWPRVTGTILLALVVFAFFFFNLHRALALHSGARFVLVLLLAPLAASGVALLRPTEPT